MAKNPKKKKPKKKKLDSIPKINRRLFKLWSIAVRNRAEHKCEFCGISKGDLNKNDVKTKIDAHHLLSRNVKNCPLKFDILNGISVCPFCHKFGIPSFHRDPITTITWLQKNNPERYEHVLRYNLFIVDLENRKVLEEIESKLVAQLPLDLDKLKSIEAEFPRKINVKVKIEGSLFDEFNEPDEEDNEDEEDEDEDNDEEDEEDEDIESTTPA